MTTEFDVAFNKMNFSAAMLTKAVSRPVSVICIIRNIKERERWSVREVLIGSLGKQFRADSLRQGNPGINKLTYSSLVKESSCGNTGSIRDDPYWISRKNSLELIELSSINKVSLV